MLRKQLDQLYFERKDKASKLKVTTQDQLAELKSETRKRNMPELKVSTFNIV